MGNTFSQIYLHLVWSTKGRRNLIPAAKEEELYRVLGGICRNINAQLIEVGGTANHIHLLVVNPIAVSVSDLIRNLKSGSSRWYRQKFHDDDRFGWQRGYGAFSVRESGVDATREYIRKQKEHHRTLSFEDEFTAFLRRHGLTFDRRYVFD